MLAAEQSLVEVDPLIEDTDPLLDAPSLWDLPFPPWPPSPEIPESPTQSALSIPVLALPISTVEAHADGAGRDLLEYYGVVPRTRADDPEEERRFRQRILMEARRGVIAVDGLYTRKADLHLGPMPKGEIIGRQRWVARKGDMRLEIALDRIQDEIESAAQREGVQVADLSTQALLVTAIDVALMMVGEWAAKIMLGLYEAANDCWRSPLFNLDVNAFLTKLGRKPEIKLDGDGVAREYHRSEAREDFRNTMRALSTVSLEIVRTIRHPDGTIADDTIERPLVFLFGGTYPHKDNPEGRRRSPSHVKVALGWYTGVRQLDGRPGTDYVPAERLQPGRGHAQHQATRERLRRRLLLYAHYRLQEMRASNQVVPPPEGYVLVRLRRNWEEVREAHAELRALAARIPDPHLRQELLTACSRLATAGAPVAPARPAAPPHLTPRELDVLCAVASGATNSAAANRLRLQPETVKSYLRSAMRKLGAHTRLEAVVAARRAGLLP